MTDAPPNRLRLPLVALVVVLAVGLLGALVFRLRRLAPRVASSEAAAVKSPVVDAVAPVVAPAGPTDNGLERAKRASAVAAIESGDYQVAIDALTEILKKGKGVGDEAELLRIAKDLEARAKAPRGEREEPLARVPRKPNVPQPKAFAPKPAPAESQLLVFSVPIGLTVEVDGTDMGATPVRRPISAGSHVVVVFKDGVRLQDRTISVAAGSVSTVDFDVRDKLLARFETPRSASSPGSVAALPPPEAKKEPDWPDPELPPVVVDPPPSPPVAPVIRAPVASQGTGEIFVAPSSLGGEVFINGTSYGALPLLAREVREGVAVVELRADGETKRRKEVVVKKSQRVEVRFR